MSSATIILVLSSGVDSPTTFFESSPTTLCARFVPSRFGCPEWQLFVSRLEVLLSAFSGVELALLCRWLAGSGLPALDSAFPAFLFLIRVLLASHATLDSESPSQSLMFRFSR